MRILITGGAGFIGSNLSVSLAKDGHKVTVLDSLSRQIHGDNPHVESQLFHSIQGCVEFIEGSVTDEAAWLKSLDGKDAIVHLAAETGTGQSMYEIRRYVDVNVAGTALMLDLLTNRKHSVKKVVVASSRALYGEGKYRGTNGIVYPGSRSIEDLRRGRFEMYDSNGIALECLPTDEESTLHPSSVYGITKLSQEQLIMTVCGAAGIPATALRYQNVYGPGQSLSNPYTGILSIFSTRILHGKPITIFEDGRESRDFVYIDDVVRATETALFDARANGQVFGIGSGVATDVLTAAKTLVSRFGVSVPIEVTGAFRSGDIRHNTADLTKARRLLDFEPAIKFDEGIGRFVEWVRTQTLPADRYDHSILELKEKGMLHD